MISTTSMALLLLVLVLSLFASQAIADPLYRTCDTTGNFTSNSTYSSNLNLLLSNLSSKASAAAGFSTSTTGSIPDRVYGLAFCRGDTNAATCRSCISMAVSNLQLLCPNSSDATVWYDVCQLRYSNEDFLHAPNVTSNIQVFMLNNENVSPDQLLRFEILTTALMGNMSDLAVRNSSRLFGTGETALTKADMIYGLVQCSQDLSVGDCRTCLQGMVDTITKDPLKGRKGGRALGLWCNMRYEFYKFYNGTSMLQLPSTQPLSPPSPQSPPSTPTPPSPQSPPSTPTPPSPPSPPSPTNGSSTPNVTNSPVDSSHRGSSMLGTILAITIPVVVALVLIA